MVFFMVHEYYNRVSLSTWFSSTILDHLGVTRTVNDIMVSLFNGLVFFFAVLLSCCLALSIFKIWQSVNNSISLIVAI